MAHRLKPVYRRTRRAPNGPIVRLQPSCWSLELLDEERMIWRATRTVAGEEEEKMIVAPCCKWCARVVVLSHFGGRVSLAGIPNTSCGAFARAAQDAATREEERAEAQRLRMRELAARYPMSAAAVARARAKHRARYHNDPEYRRRMLEYGREYERTPRHNQLRRRAYHTNRRTRNRARYEALRVYHAKRLQEVEDEEAIRYHEKRLVELAQENADYSSSPYAREKGLTRAEYYQFRCASDPEFRARHIQKVMEHRYASPDNHARHKYYSRIAHHRRRLKIVSDERKPHHERRIAELTAEMQERWPDHGN